MTALLEVTNLSRRFGELVVLDDVSFNVASGEVLGVIGPNGAGKSTLMNVISGVLDAHGGHVRLDGKDITTLPAPRRCRAGVARSYQIPRPFSDMTVFENVLVAASFGAGRRTHAPRDAALSVLEQTHLLRFANSPAGALQLLDRKRLELARALAGRPRVLLLDEIAGGLSEHEVPELIETIRGVQQHHVAVVWIEHVIQAVLALANRLMCLTYGRMLAIGAPAEVLARPDVRTTYLGVGVGAGLAETSRHELTTP